MTEWHVDVHRLRLDPEQSLGRMALHASTLGFPHPTTGAWIQVESPLPDDLAGPQTALGIWLSGRGE